MLFHLYNTRTIERLHCDWLYVRYRSLVGSLLSSRIFLEFFIAALYLISQLSMHSAFNFRGGSTGKTSGLWLWTDVSKFTYAFDIMQVGYHTSGFRLCQVYTKFPFGTFSIYMIDRSTLKSFSSNDFCFIYVCSISVIFIRIWIMLWQINEYKMR